MEQSDARGEGDDETTSSSFRGEGDVAPSPAALGIFEALHFTDALFLGIVGAVVVVVVVSGLKVVVASDLGVVVVVVDAMPPPPPPPLRAPEFVDAEVELSGSVEAIHCAEATVVAITKTHRTLELMFFVFHVRAA